MHLLAAVTLALSAVVSAHNIVGAPIDGSATAQTKALYRFLKAKYGNNILSGQTDANEITWVKNNIGKTPLVGSFDFMDYSPSRVAYGTSSHTVEDAMNHYAKGGIVAFHWHWNAPTCLYNSASQPWYSGFYTAATCFNVQSALAEGTNGANYKLILRDIDAIAVQLKRLRDAGIPVLWRPLHEAEGGWFWWGAKGSGPAKQLYNLMYDRLTNYHGLHNLIWVWNSLASSWYVGNNRCDLISADKYPSMGDHSTQSSSYWSMISLSGDTKMVTLSEVGSIPDPNQLKSQGIHWSYVVPWNGAYIEGNSWNTKSFLQSFYSNSYVISLENMGTSWKNY